MSVHGGDRGWAGDDAEVSEPVDLGIEGITDAVEVGRGGFGSVYRARQAVYDRVVAVKVLSASGLTQEAQRRFVQEIRAMGALGDHPHIVNVNSSGRTDTGQLYIVMEYMSGGSLAERLNADGPLPWPTVLDIGVKLSGALQRAHEASILHRDVKPENILVSGYGEPSLGDFGIARIQGSPSTTTGTITGTLAHAPPEILNGDRPSPRSDVYSLASSLYALLEGRAPFVSATDESLHPLIVRVLTQAMPAVRAQDVPKELSDVLARALAKDPDERTPSARTLGEQLQQVQVALGLPVTVMRVGAVAARAGVLLLISNTSDRVAASESSSEVVPPTLLPVPSAPHEEPAESLGGASLEGASLEEVSTTPAEVVQDGSADLPSSVTPSEEEASARAVSEPAAGPMATVLPERASEWVADATSTVDYRRSPPVVEPAVVEDHRGRRGALVVAAGLFVVGLAMSMLQVRGPQEDRLVGFLGALGGEPGSTADAEEGPAEVPEAAAVPDAAEAAGAPEAPDAGEELAAAEPASVTEEPEPRRVAATLTGAEAFNEAQRFHHRRALILAAPASSDEAPAVAEGDGGTPGAGGSGTTAASTSPSAVTTSRTTTAATTTTKPPAPTGGTQSTAGTTSGGTSTGTAPTSSGTTSGGTTSTGTTSGGTTSTETTSGGRTVDNSSGDTPLGGAFEGPATDPDP